VLSPSTRHTDQTDKLWASTSLVSPQVYLIVKPERRHIRVIERWAQGWSEHEVEGDGEISLPCLGAALTLKQIYESVL